MNRKVRPIALALLSVAFVTSATLAADAPALEKVADFDHQVTGVSVSKTGRIFVNFPRWSEDAPVSVGEVRDGKVVPYPDGAWNNWRNEKGPKVDPSQHFVCVQSVVVGPDDSLWAVDAAAPGLAAVVKGGPKLVKIDLASNAVAKTIPLGEDVALTGSYLNDVRFSPDGKMAYLTDSGAKGALIVVDLSTGKARRVLDGHPSTQFEKDVVVTADGKPVRQADGRGAQFAADGIALSADGKTLYWQALTGRTLYKIPTDVLNDASKSPDDVAAAVQKAGENGVSDGLLIDGDRMFISALEEDAIKVRDLTKPDAKPTVFLHDKRLRWPDTFSIGPDRALYVTTSRIQDSMYFKPGAPSQLPTALWKISLK